MFLAISQPHCALEVRPNQQDAIGSFSVVTLTIQTSPDSSSTTTLVPTNNHKAFDRFIRLQSTANTSQTNWSDQIKVIGVVTVTYGFWAKQTYDNPLEYST